MENLFHIIHWPFLHPGKKLLWQSTSPSALETLNWGNQSVPIIGLDNLKGLYEQKWFYNSTLKNS